VFRSRKRHQRRASPTAARRREPDDVSSPQDFLGASSTFVVGAPVMMCPPSYVEVERADDDSRLPPPPYVQCLQYDVPPAVSNLPAVQLCSVDDLPSPVQPTAPPPTTSNNDLTTSSSSPDVHPPSSVVEYRNPAFVQ